MWRSTVANEPECPCRGSCQLLFVPHRKRGCCAPVHSAWCTRGHDVAVCSDSSGWPRRLGSRCRVFVQWTAQDAPQRDHFCSVGSTRNTVQEPLAKSSCNAKNTAARSTQKRARCKTRCNSSARDSREVVSPPTCSSQIAAHLEARHDRAIPQAHARPC